jgi:hypothetical protein
VLGGLHVYAGSLRCGWLVAPLQPMMAFLARAVGVPW